MLESLIGPLIKQLLELGYTAYKDQKNENAIRIAEAYGRALDAWKEVEKIESDFVPIIIFKLRDSAGSGEVPNSQ